MDIPYSLLALPAQFVYINVVFNDLLQKIRNDNHSLCIFLVEVSQKLTEKFITSLNQCIDFLSIGRLSLKRAKQNISRSPES